MKMPPSSAAYTMVPSLSTSLGGWDLANISKVWTKAVPRVPWHGLQGGPGADGSSLPRQCEDQCQWLSYLHHQCPRGQPGRLPLRGFQPLWCRQQRCQPCGARYEVARVALSLSPCTPGVPRALLSPSPCPPLCSRCPQGGLPVTMLVSSMSSRYHWDDDVPIPISFPYLGCSWSGGAHVPMLVSFQGPQELWCPHPHADVLHGLWMLLRCCVPIHAIMLISSQAPNAPRVMGAFHNGLPIPTPMPSSFSRCPHGVSDATRPRDSEGGQIAEPRVPGPGRAAAAGALEPAGLSAEGRAPDTAAHGQPGHPAGEGAPRGTIGHQEVRGAHPHPVPPTALTSQARARWNLRVHGAQCPGLSTGTGGCQRGASTGAPRGPRGHCTIYCHRGGWGHCHTALYGQRYGEHGGQCWRRDVLSSI